MGRNAAIDEDLLRQAAAAFAGPDTGRVVHLESLEHPGITIRCGDDTGYPAASLSKLPLATALLLAGADGTLDLTSPVPSSSWPSTRYPSVLASLQSNLNLAELASLSIVTSDNPAAQVVLEHLPPGAWERATSVLGVAGMAPPSGFGDEHFDGMHHQHTTVDEQVAVLRTIATLDLLAPLYRWMGSSLLNQRVSAMVAPPARFHHKTGSLDGVLHDVGVLASGPHRMVVVALTRNQRDPLATQAAMVDLGVSVAAALGDPTTDDARPADSRADRHV